MAAAIHAHPAASAILKPDDGVAELAAYWTDAYINVTCRLKADFYNRRLKVIADIKTTTNVNPEPFARTCKKYRYYVQSAFYLNGFREVGFEVDDFLFIAIEKKPPYPIAIYRLAGDARSIGMTEYHNDLAVYRDCLDSGYWPGHGWNSEVPFGIQDLYLP